LLISTIPISFPSLTHLDLSTNSACVPNAISPLLLLKSLTDLQLTIYECTPKVDLIALQPLASVLTKLSLHIESKDASIIGDSKKTSTNCAECDDKAAPCQGHHNINDNNDLRMMSDWLLPFRSLTDMSIAIQLPLDDPVERSFFTIKGSFIHQHWSKLDHGTIQLHGSLNLVNMFRDFVSTPSPLPPHGPAMISSNDSSNDVNETSSLFFGIKWVKGSSLDQLPLFLEHMENASLLIPSSSSSPTSAISLVSPQRHTCIPTISLECVLEKGERQELYNRIKSHKYINTPYFNDSN
jgi:hypothetical protein